MVLEEKITFRKFIFAISWLSALGKGHVISFEQAWIPFIYIRMLCGVSRLVEIGPVVLGRRRLLNYVHAYLLFRNYQLLEKVGSFILNKLESPTLQNALCQVWLKLALWFLKRRCKCTKVTDRREDRQTEKWTTHNRQSENLTWAFSFSELKKSYSLLSNLVSWKESWWSWDTQLVLPYDL